MKAEIHSQSGNAGEIEVPKFFSIEIREDIAQKFYETQKKQQPYAPFLEAGKQHSASGNLSHSRRLWKTAYGKGISRVPRKIFWRRGDHFYWQGAEINSTRGGRAAHPPRVEHFLKNLKINKRESVIALQSVMAATSRIEMVKERYSSLHDLKLNLPLVIKSDALKLKTKEFYALLEKVLGHAFSVALQTRSQRAGRGKLRGRRSKISAGLLLVIGKNEIGNFQGIEVRRLDELEISDMWPMGRLTIYSENAVKELNEVEKANK